MLGISSLAYGILRTNEYYNPKWNLWEVPHSSV